MPIPLFVTCHPSMLMIRIAPQITHRLKSLSSDLKRFEDSGWELSEHWINNQS
ncbi:MAG: hypothetical protein ABJB61_09630 [bacterium]